MNKYLDLEKHASLEKSTPCNPQEIPCRNLLGLVHDGVAFTRFWSVYAKFLRNVEVLASVQNGCQFGETISLNPTI